MVPHSVGGSEVFFAPLERAHVPDNIHLVILGQIKQDRAGLGRRAYLRPQIVGNLRPRILRPRLIVKYGDQGRKLSTDAVACWACLLGNAAHTACGTGTCLTFRFQIELEFEFDFGT